MKPLFIPLMRDFYHAFVVRNKDTEYRIEGLRWNGITCAVGRPVTLSMGYGKKHRTSGVVSGYDSVRFATLQGWLKISLRHCYPKVTNDTRIACIRIKL